MQPMLPVHGSLQLLIQGGDVGLYTSIAIGPAPNAYAYISYYDATAQALKYATNASGSWVASTVDSGNVGQYTSIAIDSTQRAYISYYDAAAQALKYATNASNSWLTSTIGNVYVTGWTRSADFPGIGVGSADATVESYGFDGFVSKLNSSLTSLTSTFLGGSDDDISQAIAVDNSGNVYVAGYTYSTDFPCVNTTIPSCHNSGSADKTFGGYNEGFVAELNSDLSSILAATYLGGSDNDVPEALALDGFGQVIVSGYTQSSDFSDKIKPGSSFDSDFGPYYEGFIASLSSDLTSVVSATYLGGSDYDNATCVAVNSSGDIYTAGWTYSADFSDKIQPGSSADTVFSGINEGFVVRLNPLLSTAAIGYLKNQDKVVPAGSDYTLCWDRYVGTSKFTLMYSANNGKSWKTIQKGVTTTCYDWSVPLLLKNENNCLVKVTEYTMSGKKVGERISRIPFSIEVASVLSPHDGEVFTSGTTQSIVWKTNKTKRPVASAYVYYNQDGKKKWKLIASLPENPGRFSWLVPEVATVQNTYKIQVILKDSRRQDSRHRNQ